MMSATNIHFEMAERSRALNYGGIGAMHLMGQKLGLAEQIDARVQLKLPRSPDASPIGSRRGLCVLKAIRIKSWSAKL